MRRYLLPDREPAQIIDRPTLEGYVWVSHPKLGIIQMPDAPENLTPPEPPDLTTWATATGSIIGRRDSWAPAHAPHVCWFSLGDNEGYFWPDACRVWPTAELTELVPADGEARS